MKKRMRRLNMVHYAASEAEAAELKEKGFVEDPVRRADPTAQEGTEGSGEEEAAPAEAVQAGEKKALGKGSNRGKTKETAEKDDSND